MFLGVLTFASGFEEIFVWKAGGRKKINCVCGGFIFIFHWYSMFRFYWLLTSLCANFKQDTVIAPKSEYQLVLLAVHFVLASSISHMVPFMLSHIALLESENIKEDRIIFNRQIVIHCRYVWLFLDNQHIQTYCKIDMQFSNRIERTMMKIKYSTISTTKLQEVLKIRLWRYLAEFFTFGVLLVNLCTLLSFVSTSENRLNQKQRKHKIQNIKIMLTSVMYMS